MFIEAIGLFVFGTIIGSFLNVRTLRIGFTEVIRDRSACMACEASLAWYDLIPIVSYFLLRGRCRHCGSSVSTQYPLVEFITGALFLATFLMMPPAPSVWEIAGFGALLLFWASFILILVTDLRHTLIPLTFAYLLIASATLVRASEALSLGALAPLSDAALGAFVLGSFLACIVALTRGKGMGSGDIYVAVAAGVLFGLVRGIEVMMLSFWIGATTGIILMALKKSVRMKTELPFAPFMFVASLMGAFMTLWW